MAGLLVLLGVGHISVDVGEAISDFLSQSISGFSGLQVLLSGVLKISEVVDHKAGGHDMGLIDVLDKRFDAGFFDEFLLVL